MLGHWQQPQSTNLKILSRPGHKPPTFLSLLRNLNFGTKDTVAILFGLTTVYEENYGSAHSSHIKPPWHLGYMTAHDGTQDETNTGSCIETSVNQWLLPFRNYVGQVGFWYVLTVFKNSWKKTFWTWKKRIMYQEAIMTHFMVTVCYIETYVDFTVLSHSCFFQTHRCGST